jgi:hypothetical protein
MYMTLWQLCALTMMQLGVLHTGADTQTHTRTHLTALLCISGSRVGPIHVARRLSTLPGSLLLAAGSAPRSSRPVATPLALVRSSSSPCALLLDHASVTSAPDTSEPM